MLSFRFDPHFALFMVFCFLIHGCSAPVRPTPTQSSPEERNTLSDRAEPLKKRIDELLEAFAREETGRFMNMVSGDYLGNRVQLETRVDRQIQRVNNIEFEWFVDRIIPQDNHVDIQFHWDRRWRDAETGLETPAEGKTTFRLIRPDETWLLKGIRGDSPFF